MDFDGFDTQSVTDAIICHFLFFWPFSAAVVQLAGRQLLRRLYLLALFLFSLVAAACQEKKEAPKGPKKKGTRVDCPERGRSIWKLSNDWNWRAGAGGLGWGGQQREKAEQHQKKKTFNC